MKCLKCNSNNSDTSKYCCECGAPLLKKCNECGSICSINAKFCPQCGKRFDDIKIDIIKYQNKLTFHDYVFIKKAHSGSYIIVIDKGVIQILNIYSLKPTFDYTFDSWDYDQKDYQDFTFLRRNGKWGIVNAVTGKLITDFIYDDYLRNDHAGTEFRMKQNNLWGKVDALTGKTMVPFIYEKIEFDDRVKYHGYWGWLTDHVLSIPCEYINLSSYRFSDNIYPSEHRSGKWGVITQLGKIVIEFEYDEIEYHEPFGHSLYYLRKNDKWGLYCEGKRFPCTYTKEEVKKLKWY